MAVLVVLAGCDYPRDAEGTLDRARGGVIRVGFAERPPFVVAEGGRREGIEPRLVRAFAEELGASIEWVAGSQLDLLHALEKRRLDLVICGFPRDAPVRKHGARSLPYLQTRDREPQTLVILAVPGENRFLLELDRFIARKGRRLAREP